MIPVTPVPEPKDFDTKVRQLGKAWLAANPNAKVKDLWSLYRGDLADGFHDLCGYSAIHCPHGTVDHYLSKDNKNALQNRALAYEWANYRYAAGWVNSSKGNEDDAILDPYHVGEGWFEIRAGRIRSDRFRRLISGSPAGCCHDTPLRGLTEGGRSPTGVRPRNGGENHAAAACGRSMK